MFRVSLGLASLTLTTMFAAFALRLIPDRDGAIIEGRKNLCEAVAIASSLAVQRNDIADIQAEIQAVCKRNPDIQAACVRRANGDVLAEAGTVNGWGDPRSASTAGQMQAPIVLDQQLWGDAEFSFSRAPAAPGKMCLAARFCRSVGSLLEPVFC